jgi:NADPH2:quinone reductase
MPVPVRTATLKPEGLSFEDAAALPLAGLTALQTLERAGVGAGQTVLIHGAAGGVGSFGVQLARRLGARVVGTASERNHAYLRDLGAEPVVYGEGLVPAAREIAPRGSTSSSTSSAARRWTRRPTCSPTAASSPRSPTPARAPSSAATTCGCVRTHRSSVSWLSSSAGELRVEIAATYPLDEAAAAYAALEEGHTRGKIVVTV